MHGIYRTIAKYVVNLYYWALDYLYVSFWQVMGFVRQDDPKRYVSSAHPEFPPVILIPGIYEKWHFMKPIADLLYNEGYSVHVVEGLGYNTGSIEIMAEKVNEYVEQLHIDEYMIVAHSKGGLIAKYLMTVPVSRVLKTITINTPFSGSKYARLFPSKAIRLFLPTSQIITALAKNREINRNITSIYGLFDPHIPSGSYLEGATNVKVAARGHFRVIKSQKVHTVILKSLQNRG